MVLVASTVVALFGYEGLERGRGNNFALALDSLCPVAAELAASLGGSGPKTAFAEAPEKRV